MDRLERGSDRHGFTRARVVDLSARVGSMHRDRRSAHDWVYRTGRWKRLRLVILRRDGHRCQVVERGRMCGLPANTVGHIAALADGGLAFAPWNLRAECKAHASRGGAAIRARHHGAYEPQSRKVTSRRVWIGAIDPRNG